MDDTKAQAQVIPGIGSVLGGKPAIAEPTAVTLRRPTDFLPPPATERDQLLAERRALLAERDQLLVERDTLRRQRDELLQLAGLASKVGDLADAIGAFLAPASKPKGGA